MGDLATVAAAGATGLDPRLPKAVRVSVVEKWIEGELPDAAPAARRQAAEAAVAGKAIPPPAPEPKTTVADPVTKTSRKRPKLVKLPSPVKSATTARGLMLQAVSLVALYWLVRTPQAVATAADGATSAFRWLASTRGIPGR